MKQRFELVSGAWTYWEEFELDEKKKRVLARSGSYVTTEGDDGKVKKKIHKFDDALAAAKYFRYRLQRSLWTNVSEQPLAIDPTEDFKTVKDRSADYRYLERAETGLFWDIDRDYSTLICWSGPVGERGEEQRLEHSWDGDAKRTYKELLQQKLDEGYVERAAQGISFAEAQAAEYGELPARYVAFLEGGEAKRLAGWYLSGLPTYPGDKSFKVSFDDSKICELAALTSFSQQQYAELVPFCVFGGEQNFLAFDRSQPELPVTVFIDAPYALDVSFDAFLARLHKTAGQSPYKKLKVAYERAERHSAQDDDAKVIETLTDPLALFPPRNTSRDYYDESDDLRNVLAASYNLLGLALRSTGKLKESLVQFENAARVGAMQVGAMPKLNLLATRVYHQRAYQKALNYGATFQAHTPYARFYRSKALAFAHVGLAHYDEARAAYEALWASIADDAEKQQILRDELTDEDDREGLDETQGAFLAEMAALGAATA